MDGTLLNRDFTIPPRTRKAIAAARERGVHFVLVTGRMYQSAVPYALELGLEGMPLSSYNGALVKEFPSGKTIHHDPVPLEAAKAIAALADARGYHVQAYVNDELYLPDMGPRSQEYLKVANVQPHVVGPLADWLTQPSTKMLIIDEPGRIPQIQAEIRERAGDVVRSAPSYPMYLEIISSSASKGTALSRVAASLGVPQEAVMAVGDGMNDMSMIRWAGTSFAMAHAPEALRQAATHVTEGGPGDGVAEALERMGLVG